MRKTILTLLFATIATMGYAQENRQNIQRSEGAPNPQLYENMTRREIRREQSDTIKDYPNGRWFFGMGGGVQYYFGDHNRQASIEDVLTPKVDIYAGRWLNNVWAVRVGGSGLNIHGLTNPHWSIYDEQQVVGNTPNNKFKEYSRHGYRNYFGTHQEYKCKNSDYLERQQFKYFNLHADIIFNLTQAMYPDDNDADYMVDIMPYAGFGWAHGWTRHNHHEENDYYQCPDYYQTNSYSVNGGFYTTVKLNKNFSLVLDVHAALVRDNFDKDRGERIGEGILGATLGLNFHF